MEEPPGDHVNTMGNEYMKAREEFDPMFYLIGLVFFVMLYYCINRDYNSKPKQLPKLNGEGDPKKTFFTKEQLRTQYSGPHNGLIYLACNDTVFNVTGSPYY